jgi:predicted adenylyl cyclase CyaB
MANIECEIRTFLTPEQYEQLAGRLKKEAEFLGEDDQVTYYFDAPEDLRIQKNDHYSKVWLKKGAIHDEHREEIEVKYDKDDFEKLEQLFAALGYGVTIKWFRKRLSFRWGDIDVALDHTKGYGYILELEKMATEEDKEQTVAYLKQKLGELGIPPTPKEEFDKKYQHYKDHWQELV